MTNAKLANELQAISQELDQIRADERDAANQLDQRFAQDLWMLSVRWTSMSTVWN